MCILRQRIWKGCKICIHGTNQLSSAKRKRRKNASNFNPRTPNVPPLFFGFSTAPSFSTSFPVNLIVGDVDKMRYRAANTLDRVRALFENLFCEINLQKLRQIFLDGFGQIFSRFVEHEKERVEVKMNNESLPYSFMRVLNFSFFFFLLYTK